MTTIEIGVSNLQRSLDFYAGLIGLPEADTEQDDQGRQVQWLGRDGGWVRLVEFGTDRTLPTDWDRDDRQCGIRHFGMKVTGIDDQVSRLKAAGVTVAREPLDAFGGVRIAFFFDPDGSYLEFVEGYVQHNELWSAELAQQEVDGDRDWDGTPRFDHVAVSVPDLDDALTDYRDGLGFGGVGQLVRPDDGRGFLITNLRMKPGTLELFSFSVPTYRRTEPDLGEPTDFRRRARLGLRALGLPDVAEPRLGVGGVPLIAGR